MNALSLSNYQSRFQGAMSCGVVALASLFLAENYGAPVMLFALLLGMSVNFLYEQDSCIDGIDFCSATVLRFGVVMLGARILLGDVAALGWSTGLLVVAGVVSTIAFGAGMAKLLRLDHRFGMLSGGAVAICGISAAMTLSSVMPKNRDIERYTLLTVIMVATFGAVAMVAYPVFASWLQLNEMDSGIFIGGSIHDVSHVVGASYNMSDGVGEVAMIVKMLRVVLLVPVAWVFLLMFRKENAKLDGAALDGAAPEGAAKVKLPFFLLAFVIVVAVNNVGLIPTQAAILMDEVSRACFVLAIVALGMKTSFKGLIAIGWQPMALVLAESCFLGFLVMAWVMM